MTTRGRVTIPKEVREKLRLKTGARIGFVVESSGRVVIQPPKSIVRLLHKPT
jgi:AbrB family looped-hinge helix DNA binding protein